MIDAIRSEWIKVSTITVTRVLAIIAVAFPLLITVLSTALADTTWSGEDLADLVGGLTIVTALMLGVVATIAITNEFGHGTIRPTFAAMPDRLRPLLAKPIVQVAVTLVLTVATVVVSWLVGSVLSGDSPSLGDGATLPALVGVVLLAIGVTLLGYGLGLLIRNSPAAICLLLLWPLLAENLVAALLTGVGAESGIRFLPYSAGFAMAVTGDPDDSLGRVGGGLYFFAWVVVIVVVGIATARRRDA